jgi:hypothetical protein
MLLHGLTFKVTWCKLMTPLLSADKNIIIYHFATLLCNYIGVMTRLAFQRLNTEALHFQQALTALLVQHCSRSDNHKQHKMPGNLDMRHGSLPNPSCLEHTHLGDESTRLSTGSIKEANKGCDLLLHYTACILSFCHSCWQCSCAWSSIAFPQTFLMKRFKRCWSVSRVCFHRSQSNRFHENILFNRV